VINGLQHIFEK